jgi:hypothetical protein
LNSSGYLGAFPYSNLSPGIGTIPLLALKLLSASYSCLEYYAKIQKYTHAQELELLAQVYENAKNGS